MLYSQTLKFEIKCANMFNSYSSQSLSILYEDLFSLPLLSKEDVEDPNPTAGVEPKPPAVDT